MSGGMGGSLQILSKGGNGDEKEDVYCYDRIGGN